MMKEKKMIFTLVFCLGAALLSGCSRQDAVMASGGILIEESTAQWNQVLEEACGISDFGKPLGTAEETLDLSGQVFSVTFKIDGEITQALMDGYAQSVWRACEKAAAASNESSSGYRYSRMSESMRRQEPLNYYIWYYTIVNQRYRIGIYSTNMEKGVPGGLVLVAQGWS